MKNKKSLYILIPLVVVVWGFIFWKFFLVANAEPKLNYTFQEKKSDKDTSELSYKINANYPDPFFTSRPHDLSSSPMEIKKNKIQSFEQTSIRNLQEKPNLTYFGCIICGNKKTGLIEINSNKYLVKELTKQEEQLIVSIWEDSLKIKVNELYYTYYKQN